MNDEILYQIFYINFVLKDLNYIPKINIENYNIITLIYDNSNIYVQINVLNNTIEYFNLDTDEYLTLKNNIINIYNVLNIVDSKL